MPSRLFGIDVGPGTLEYAEVREIDIFPSLYKGAELSS